MSPNHSRSWKRERKMSTNLLMPFAEKMSTLPLSRSEVFGQLRKELYEDKEFHHTDVHIFIILGASVS